VEDGKIMDINPLPSLKGIINPGGYRNVAYFPLDAIGVFHSNMIRISFPATHPHIQKIGLRGKSEKMSQKRGEEDEDDDREKWDEK